MRTVHLATPPGVMDVSLVGPLQTACTWDQPQAARVLRRAVLMGTHGRVGACSQLLKLPRDMLEVCKGWGRAGLSWSYWFGLGMTQGAERKM